MFVAIYEYVDNYIVVGSDAVKIENFLEKMKRGFCIQYDSLNIFPGNSVHVNENSTLIEPETYARKVLKQFWNSPDITCSSSTLSQNLEKPKRSLWTAIKRIDRYIKVTEDRGLLCKSIGNQFLEVYANAGYSGDTEQE